MEEEGGRVGGAKLLAGLMALIISGPFLEKLNSLPTSGGILLSYREGGRERGANVISVWILGL